MPKANGKTEVAVVNGGGVSVFDASKFKAGATNMSKRGSGRAEFLHMDKQGEWFYGAIDTQIGPNQHLYVDPMGSVYGWQCWANTDIKGVSAELLGSKLVPVHEPLPPMPTEQFANGRDWTEARGISLLMGSTKLTYTTTSLGGKDAIAALLAAQNEQYDEDPTKMVAVVSLANDWYKHKKWGKTYVPVFKVLKWVSAPPADGTVAKAAATTKAVIAKAAAKKAAPARKAAR